MLRPATSEALDRLLRAASDVDRELDTALTCLGVLPPLDLAPIRSRLLLHDIQLRAGQNADGHRIIEIVEHDVVLALIDHDGTVTDGDPTPAEPTAA